MSGAIAGVLEIAVGAILEAIPSGITQLLGSSLVMAGAGQLLGYAVSLLVNPRRGPLIPIGASYSGTLEESLSIPETDEELLRIYQSD